MSQRLLVAGLGSVALITGFVLGHALDPAGDREEIAKLSEANTSLVASLSQAREERDGFIVKRDRAEAQVRSLENDLASMEEDLAEREQEASALEAELEKEAALLDEHEAVFEESQASEWWIPKMRECLARSGSYISGTATISSYGGNDFSCYQG